MAFSGRCNNALTTPGSFPAWRRELVFLFTIVYGVSPQYQNIEEDMGRHYFDFPRDQMMKVSSTGLSHTLGPGFRSVLDTYIFLRLEFDYSLPVNTQTAIQSGCW